MTSKQPVLWVAAVEDFLKKNCLKQIQHVADAEDADAVYSVAIDTSAFETSHPEACRALLVWPEEYLPLVNEALRNVECEISDEPKKYLHARFRNLPRSWFYNKETVSKLRATDLGALIQLKGTVTRTGGIMLREIYRAFTCVRCKHQFQASGDLTRKGAFTMPRCCPSDEGCSGTSFAQVDEANPVCHEYQEIKITEKLQDLEVGSIPRSIVVVLTADLADSVKPGDNVVVVGLLTRRWHRNVAAEARGDVEFQLVAQHVTTTNEKKSFLHISEEAKQQFGAYWSEYEEPTKQLVGRDIILRSIAPQICGNYLVKLILAMTLIGGVSYTDPSGGRIRGESHLLIVGDPGTAKSQVLRYAARISPRAVLTTGIGTTSAGLTVTAVRDVSGEWMLDAGALVLADGGVACIDEFDSIRQHDRGAIHEAMEQQTLSIAKAGLVCTLETNTTVIAAVNPKNGRLSTAIGSTADEGEGEDELSIHVGIAAPLLSRFDVVLTLLDQFDEDWDKRLSDFILNGYKAQEDKKDGPELWTSEQLRQYLFLVKSEVEPKLSASAQTLITTYYQCERTRAARNTARTTVRLLEALVRLAQAHARLMFRSTTTGMDAVFAIAAVESSAAALQIVGGLGALHAPFPNDPMAEFDRYAGHLLDKLQLDDGVIDFFDDGNVDGARAPSQS